MINHVFAWRKDRRRALYGIAFPASIPLREDDNRAPLKLQEDGTYDQLFARWYGKIFD